MKSQIIIYNSIYAVAYLINVVFSLIVITICIHQYRLLSKTLQPKLIISLSLTIIIYSIPLFLVILPCVFTKCLLPEIVNEYMNTLPTCAYFLHQATLLLLGIERFFVFYWKHLRVGFLNIETYLIIFIWIITTVIVIMSTKTLCHVPYELLSHFIFISCPSIWTLVNSVMTQILSYSLFIIYFFISYKIRCLNKLRISQTSDTIRREIKLAIQCGIVSGVGAIGGLAFNFIPILFPGDSANSQFVVFLLDYINFLLTNIFFLFFNKPFKQAARHTLRMNFSKVSGIKDTSVQVQSRLGA